MTALLAMWLPHGFFTVLMFAFIGHYSVLPIWHYLALITLPRRPLPGPLLLRTPPERAPRTAFGAQRSCLARREQWLARSGGFLIRGYGELFRCHSLSPIDSPQHPHV